MNTSTFFEYYYNNAEVNSIMIMDCDGVVLDVNKSFSLNFGYNNEDIKGRNFSILFNKADNLKNKPKMELVTVTTNRAGT
jgi:PAS domain S-box-containing protein